MSGHRLLDEEVIAAGEEGFVCKKTLFEENKRADS
jgi:hypothetical protein